MQTYSCSPVRRIKFLHNGYFKPSVFFALTVAWLQGACGPHSSPSEGAVPDGRALYRQHCVVCHGADGALALNGAADLPKSVLSLEERVHRIAHGKNTMPPFGALLKEEEILAIALYIETFRHEAEH
jgi:mono/diheme cytochrome c family protein